MAEVRAVEARGGSGPRAGCLLVAAACAVIVVAGSVPQDPLVVWNSSASSPRGLYLFSPRTPRPGDFVIARPPAAAAALAAARGYLPRGLPLVKTMAAGDGDRVCAHGRWVWINARLAAARRPADRAGRALPWWSGCRTLGRGEMLLFGQTGASSFDGRYFGPTRASEVIGVARPLWPA